MAIPVIMPRQGQSVESCIITKWLKKKGDAVKQGDILFSYETDKASFDEEAKADGTMLEIFFDEGEDIPVLTNVCVIGSPGESAAEFDPRGHGKQGAAAGNSAKSGAGEGVGAGAEGGAAGVTRAAGAVGAAETAASAAHAAASGEAAGLSTPAASSISTDAPAGGKLKISPRARSLAEKKGIDYRYAIPTGPDGRITEKDILAMQDKGPFITPAARDASAGAAPHYAVTGTGLGGRITTADVASAAAVTAAAGAGLDRAAGTRASASPEASAPAASAGSGSAPASQIPASSSGTGYEEVKLSNIRKVIARAMVQSLATAAQLTNTTSFDASEILKYRQFIKENTERLGLGNITLNDIVLFAVSRTLLRHKDLNAHLVDDRLLRFGNVHLGVAVDTDRGLMVPTIFDANLKSLGEISKEVKALSSECQKGTIKPDYLKGASFTVSNLGSFGIESFTPVINPPQTGILGVNTIVQRARESKGEYRFYPAMGLSLTYDHRVVDGAPASRFLQDLCKNLENFSLLLVM